MKITIEMDSHTTPADTLRSVLGALAGVPVTVTKAQAPAEAPKAAEAPAPEKPKPAAKKAAEAPKPAEEPKVEAPKVEEPKPEPAKAAKAPKADKPAAEKPPTNGVAPLELPDAVKATGSMKELLHWLVEEGKVATADDLVAQCIALKDQVPILGKVPDVDQRVRRAVEVLGLFASTEG